MICPTCFKSNFRLSRFRSKDVVPILTLRYPVRCRVCKHRMYAGPFVAYHLFQSRRRKGQAAPAPRTGDKKAA